MRFLGVPSRSSLPSQSHVQTVRYQQQQQQQPQQREPCYRTLTDVDSDGCSSLQWCEELLEEEQDGEWGGDVAASAAVSGKKRTREASLGGDTPPTAAAAHKRARLPPGSYAEEKQQVPETAPNKQKMKGGRVCSSQFVGVNWVERVDKWRACGYYSGKSIHLGYFSKEGDAAQAYLDFAQDRGCARDHVNVGPAKMRQKRAGSSSRFCGVYWSKKEKWWKVQVSVEGVNHYFGHYDDEEDAARRYNMEARKLGFPPERLNVIDEDVGDDDDGGGARDVNIRAASAKGDNFHRGATRGPSATAAPATTHRPAAVRTTAVNRCPTAAATKPTKPTKAWPGFAAAAAALPPRPRPPAAANKTAAPASKPGGTPSARPTAAPSAVARPSVAAKLEDEAMLAQIEVFKAKVAMEEAKAALAAKRLERSRGGN